MKILIGHDGSQSADAALADLQRAGLPDEAETLIVSVADVMMVSETPGYELAAAALMSRRVASGLASAQRQTERVLKETKDFASRAGDRVRSYFPAWRVRAETLAGPAAAELIRKANDWKPDLIVVGSHGRSSVNRFILGSVSKKVVTDSSHSVRVSRGNTGRDLSKPPKVVIGVDGSLEAEQAIRTVGNRVWPHGTKVKIVTVDDGVSPRRIAQILPTAAEMIGSSKEEAVKKAQEMAQWAADELRVIGLGVSVVTEKGDPRRVLIDQAKAWDADSIFVGGRRFSSTLERLQLGSVATALVTKAHCSVEVARIE
ncbi:MAG TPA: universal stress protein [Pyrinomonadaceae bacterium]|nr:universal stress protein [Pyrinomonadaceae bacterium]